MTHAQLERKTEHIKQNNTDDNALIVLRQRAKTLSNYEMTLWLSDEKLKLERIAISEYAKYGILTTARCLYQSKKVDMMLNLIQENLL